MIPRDLILGPQVALADNYFDRTFITKARDFGLACPATPPTDDAGLNSFVLLNYYDLPLVQYIAHARTGDEGFLTLARKCADSWALHPQWIGNGKIRLWPDNAAPPPRHAGLGGLILRALDGRDDLWDWIASYTSYFHEIYVKRNVVANAPMRTNPREAAFVMHAMAWLVRALPDSFPTATGIRNDGATQRATYLTDLEAAMKYYASKQRDDGAWVWDDDFIDTDGGLLKGVTQPFIVGLLHAALCDVHEVVGSATREIVKTMLMQGCRHLYSGGPYIKDEIEQNSGKRIRGFHYFYHGGTTVNPTRYEKGDMKFPWTAVEAWWLPSARQAISTILPAFWKAFQISGDTFFRDAGDELYDSAYSGADGIRAMLDDTAKNFNQHGRRVPAALAWRGGAVVPPVPLPEPIPTPTPTPSPDGTKATTITDNNGGVWTLGADGQTLRNGVHMGSGGGKIYKWLNGTVYVLGMNDNWYKWAETAWVKVGAEPGVEEPTPTPDPPPPPPVPIPCSISAPASISIPRNGTGTIAVTLQDVSSPTEVKVLGSDGQVTVTPLSWNAGPTSTVKQFQVKVKKQGRTITFTSRCGVVAVKVSVV